MEKIVYRKTLDVHKNGVQFTLQGFETADKMARTIEISLMASGDTIDLPLEQLSAIMYVTTPKATEPSINECTIKDNTIICDIPQICEAGITEIKLKLIETRPEGANGVLATPKFAIEVSESGTDDESATQTTTYTALENALAMAKGVYDARIIRVEIDRDCMFRVIYADGSIYETDVLNETLLKGEAILSQSYARGGTGTRTGEDTDNSKYYSNVSRSAAEDARIVRDDSAEIYEEVKKHGVYTAFSLDFETGEMKYISPLYKFSIDKENGELDVIGETYTPDETIDKIVTEWLASKTAKITELENIIRDGFPRIDGNLDYLTNAVDENASNFEKFSNRFEYLKAEKFMYPLWSGNWSDGTSVSIDNSRNYNLFKIYLDDFNTAILAIRIEDTIIGIGGASKTHDTRTYHFTAKIENDVWSSKVCFSGNPYTNSAFTTHSVVSVFGMI